MRWLRFFTFPTFETERLILRPLRTSDYKDLYEIFKDREHLKYFGIPSVQTLSDAKQLTKDWVQRLEPFGFLRWTLVLKTNEKAIGTIGLHSFNSHYKKGAVGYELNAAYQHQGYIQEALQMVMRYFFEDLGYHRLEAIIVKENLASIRVVERAGFVCEGLMRQWMYQPQLNVYFDAAIYALLDSEYVRGTDDL